MHREGLFIFADLCNRNPAELLILDLITHGIRARYFDLRHPFRRHDNKVSTGAIRGLEAPTVGDFLAPSTMERLRLPTHAPLGRLPLARRASPARGSDAAAAGSSAPRAAFGTFGRPAAATLAASAAAPPFVEPALVDRLGRGKRDALSMSIAIDETRRIKDSMFAAHGIERFRAIRCPLLKANVRLRTLERLRAHEQYSGERSLEGKEELERREEEALHFSYDKLTASLTTLPVRAQLAASAPSAGRSPASHSLSDPPRSLPSLLLVPPLSSLPPARRNSSPSAPRHSASDSCSKSWATAPQRCAPRWSAPR